MVVALDTPDPRLRPGTSVQLVVEGPTVEDALVLPRQAIFEREGKTLVFVRTATGFEPQEVTVLHRGESRAAIDGVGVGVEVALIAPDVAGSAAGSGAPPTPAAGSAGAPVGTR